LASLPAGTEIRRTESWDFNRLAWRFSPAARSIEKGRKPAAVSATNKFGRRVLDVARAWALLPDDRMGWIPFATRAGRRWLLEKKFDAVYSTCFPHSAHVVGERLARRSGLPFLADFRDIWIGNYYFYAPATPLHDRIQRAMERRVIERAGSVVSATAPITDDFRARYPQQRGGKFLTITNGYDDEDFAGTPVVDSEHFTITYAGTMYGSTSPEGFFAAIAALRAGDPELTARLRLRFLGSMIEPYRAMIGAFGLSDITRVEGYLAHDEALRAMAAADALLLIVADQPGSNIMLTQKVFEYVAARRPVIGLVPDGAAKDFLREIGEGPIVPPLDRDAIAAAVRPMLEGFAANGRSTLGHNPMLAKYHRRELTRALCGALDGISAPT